MYIFTQQSTPLCIYTGICVLIQSYMCMNINKGVFNNKSAGVLDLGA